MSDFKYDDDLFSDAVEEIEPVAEEVIEEPIVEEPVEAPVVEEKVEEPKAKKKAKKEEVEEEAPKEEKVALYSTRSIFWEGVGQVKTGYNIVTKAQADRWLTRNHIRVATPEEILKEING